MPTASPHSSWFQTHRPGLVVMAIVLLLHGLLALLRHSETLIWDEGRYLKYADFLTEGFYVEDANPDFVNGPGYPIVLMPFTQGFHLGARLLNAFFMAGSVGFVWLTLRRYAGVRWGVAGALLVGLHPTLVWMSFSIMTECLALFCLTGFMWAFCLALSEGGWRWMAAASGFLGWLTLTRVFFGHVMLASALMCVALMVLPLWRPLLKRCLLILAGAMLICVPYLTYTWQKTGEVMCWSTNSGELLYWMTSGHEGENGHWFSYEDAVGHPELAEIHASFYSQAMKMPVLQREAVLKAAAMANLRAHPEKFVYNWLCNLARLAFGFPRSHQPEELRSVVLIAVNGPIILLSCLLGLVGLWRWRAVPVEVWVLMGFTAFYLGGSSIAPALPRYFVVVFPLLLLGMAIVWNRHVHVGLKPLHWVDEVRETPP